MRERLICVFPPPPENPPPPTDPQPGAGDIDDDP